MSVRRIAMLSVHTSPLAQPGSGDGGGMNVYVRSLAGALACAGVECDLLTRCEDPRQRAIVDLEPGVRVVHLRAGPQVPVDKRDLPDLVDPLVDAARAHLVEHPGFDGIHANYWISGVVGHRLKHQLDLPLVTTFHTLGLSKSLVGIDDDPNGRVTVERQVVACSDQLTASTVDERAELVDGYGADPERVEVIPPGVDHRVFAPGDAVEARRRLHLPLDRAVLLFVGRIQPLKGADLALRCLAELPEWATLVVVGGPSGAEGPAELDRLHALACDARRRRPRPLGPAATTRGARGLVPRGRRVSRAVAERVVRPGRARSRGVRHASGRGERRWAAFARRRRRDRVPRRRPRARGVRGARRRAARRSRARRRDRRRGRRALGSLHVEHHRGAAASRSTPTSVPASSSLHLSVSAGDDPRELEARLRAAHALVAEHLEGPVAREP